MLKIKCLCIDGTAASRGEVILAGVLSFSGLGVPAGASERRVCKFGVYFLCPGRYTFALARKEPKGTFYSNSLVVEVAPANRHRE